MAKLRNNTEYFNDHFPPEFGDYLLTNGFALRVSSLNKILGFTKDNKQLIVHNDHIDYYHFNDEMEGQPADKWVFVQSHTGIVQLNIYGWIMLMHAMGVQDISQFVPNAKKISAQDAVEAKFLVREMQYSQQPAILV